MASSNNPQLCLNQKLYIQLLFSFLIMTLHVCPGIAADIYLRGEVGGNVTIHCPVKEQSKLEFFYFQRGNSFVNGYHAIRDISKIPTWNNTKLDPQNTTVYMYNLSASHNGDYSCLIEYKGDPKNHRDIVHLDVTANYSTPEFTLWCDNGSSCMGKCTSHGGYPRARMMWNVPSSSAWRLVNDSDFHDPQTKLFSVTSFASFNCSQGELKGLSCFVSDVTSDAFAACTPSASTEPHHNVTVAAIGIVLGFCSVVLVILLWWWRKCKKRQIGGVTRQKAGANGIQGETEALNITETP